MHLTKTLLFLVVCSFFISVQGCKSLEKSKEDAPVFYYFYSPTCPHCKAAEGYIKNISEKHPELKLEKINIYDSQENQEFYKKTLKKHGLRSGVPLFIMGDSHVRGFSKKSGGKRIESMISKEKGK
ncbi:MAG: thioredoxin family protein [bacterium]